MGNKRDKLLFGLETEYGFTATDTRGDLLGGPHALDLLLSICARKLVHLQGLDSSARMYLANGALLYPDVGHPEYATAECFSPESLLKCVRAGEQILVDAAQEFQREVDVDDVRLYRTNVDYAAIGTTWGCHESYLSHRRPADFAEQVVPHLASRIVYSGAGGFDNGERGASFVLSPRVPHLRTAISRDSRGNRAIFSLRDDPLSGNRYFRVHLICGESNCSELTTYLKIGTTALVIAMADAGVDFGFGPGIVPFALDAMRRFNRDPGCSRKAICNDSLILSAVEVQYRYLEAAERRLAEPYMPAWAGELCARWREVLDALASGQETLVGRLDWPTKLALFRRFTETRSELSWESLAVWSSVATRLSRTLAGPTNAWPRIDAHQAKLLLGMKGSVGRIMKRQSALLDKHGLDWSGIDAFQALRDELCELDLRYGQLFPKGIFIELDEAGRIPDHFIEPADVDRATRQSPDPGRPRIRGEWIRRIVERGDNYHCHWTGISGATEHLDLGDPFVAAADWQPVGANPAP